MAEQNHIESLIQGLREFQKEAKVQEVLEAALTEPMPTEEHLRQIEQALETFKALGLFGKDDAQDLHLLQTLGRTYERLAHLEKAFETYETAIGLTERLRDEENRAYLLCRMGRVLSRWDRCEEALDYIDRSQRIYEGVEDEHGLARVTLSRGIVFYLQGNYEAAAAAYGESLEVAQRVGDMNMAANVTNNQAVLSTIKGDLDEAVSQYEASLGMFREAEDDRGIARSYYNLGKTHVDRQDWTSAMDCFERGFEVAQKDGYLDAMANMHVGMAEVLLALGNSMMVPMCCARALDTYRKIGNRIGEADTYRLLGRTFTLRKEWTTAEGLFKDSLGLYEEYSNPLGIAEAYRDLGEMQVAQGRQREARVSFESALAGVQKLGAQGDVAEVERLLQDLD